MTKDEADQIAAYVHAMIEDESWQPLSSRFESFLRELKALTEKYDLFVRDASLASLQGDFELTFQYDHKTGEYRP